MPQRASALLFALWSTSPPSVAIAIKNIAILLIIKGIAIAFVNLFDYICIALK